MNDLPISDSDICVKRELIALTLTCVFLGCNSSQNELENNSDRDVGRDSVSIKIADLIDTTIDIPDILQDLGTPLKIGGEISAPEDCATSEFKQENIYPRSRLKIGNSDDIIWLWGKDHYVDRLDITTERSIRDSEIIRPQMFPLPSNDSAIRYYTQSGALHTRLEDRNYFSTQWYMIINKMSARRETIAVSDSGAAMIVDENEILYSCGPELRCEFCELSVCTRLAQLPEKQAPRALDTGWVDGMLVWAGEKSIWITNLQTGVSTVIVESANARALTSNSDGWIAWVENDGHATLRSPDDRRWELARDLPEPPFDEVNFAYLRADLDVLEMDDEHVFWLDQKSLPPQVRAFNFEDMEVKSVPKLQFESLIALRVSRCAFFALDETFVHRIPR